MSWKRLGVVFAPDGNQPWARSHAALPTPVHVAGDVFRFFYSSRDAERRSHVGWVDVEVSETPHVLSVAGEPILSPGVDGSFDDSGVSIGCITQADGVAGLYYMGWNLGVRSPWRNAIGLARARTLDGPFERVSPGPILDRSPEDPYTFTYPCVVKLGPRDWRMWYGSNLEASLDHEHLRHVIKVARSQDGVRWERDGATVIGLTVGGEHVIARPSVVRIGPSYLMSFATRGDTYRLGGARSADGVQWQRIDAVMGLDRSHEGWDADMICYPALFWHRDRLWLAYNGNGYGATGFGLAVWEGAHPLAAIPGRPTTEPNS
jgi:hypothetical protein